MYEDLVARLKLRASIRREMRLRNGDAGRDRIADDLEHAAAAIEDLQDKYETSVMLLDWRDEY